MGVFGTAARGDTWAQDPEALLVFSLAVARRDPRLFDELLDWLRRNRRLISTRRIGTMIAADNPNRPLLEATLEWAAENGVRRRLPSRPPTGEPQPLFPGLRVSKPDDIFFAHGFLKPAAEPSHKSGTPDLAAPINFAFRLREHFGLSSSRAEVVRFLLTMSAPDANVATVARAAGFSKRNVNETLAALTAAGSIRRVTRGNEGRYSIDRTRWAAFLNGSEDDLPVYRDWPQLLPALHQIDRWLDNPEIDDLTDYMRASEARSLMVEVAPLLANAGIPPPRDRDGAEYWSSFEETADRLLEQLHPDANGVRQR